MIRTQYHPRGGRLPWVLATLLLGATGCATSGRHISGWSDLTVRPGDTVTCHSNPCRIFFEMPPGHGRYRLTGTGYTIGEYPAGATVMIGSFFTSSAIRVQGAGVPPAYIYVPGSVASGH